MQSVPIVRPKLTNGKIKPLMNFLSSGDSEIRNIIKYHLIFYDLSGQIFPESGNFPKQHLRRLPLISGFKQGNQKAQKIF